MYVEPVVLVVLAATVVAVVFLLWRRRTMTQMSNFMWGFQEYFHALAAANAKELFARLDQRLVPRVFLVGIRLSDREAFRAACMHPEDCGYDPAILADAVRQAERLRAMQRAYPLVFCDRTSDDHHQRETLLNQLTSAVRTTIADHASSKDRLTFCSRMVPVDEFAVTTVLQLDLHAYEACVPHLSHAIAEGMFAVLPSLADAVSAEFVAACRVQLNLRNPGGAYIPWPDPKELLRTAAAMFMVTPAAAGKSAHDLYGLFDACNAISALPYEGQEGMGRLIVARPQHPSVRVDVSLSAPARVGNHRAARKLLETSSDRLSLLSDAAVIYGLGHLADYDPAKEDLFVVRFVKHFTWVLSHANRPLMRVENGEPSLPRNPFDIVRFRRTLDAVFPGITDAQVTRLVQSAEVAARQRHGTMLVVTQRAAEEAHRLRQQATPIQTKRLDDSEVEHVTRIDGAVLLDPEGVCHAIGVILDGIATEQGNPARGARFNSAIRYVASQNNSCVAVVISEDGMIDFFPAPRD